MDTTTAAPAMTIAEALALYQRRQRDREHIPGSFDRSGRWYPADSERRPCCGAIRSPSAAYPYSLMTHCRTAAHVAALGQVDLAALRRAIRAASPRQATAPTREGGDDYYKMLVRLPSGHMVNPLDGQTIYQLGVTLTQPARQNHGGGYYCYASLDAAMVADVPIASSLHRYPRLIIRCRAEGAYCRYGDKLSFSRLTPLRVVGQVVTPYGWEPDRMWPGGIDPIHVVIDPELGIAVAGLIPDPAGPADTAS